MDTDVGIILITVLLTIYVMWFLIASYKEKALYNRGICKCGGNYEEKWMDSQGGVEFVCNKCGNNINIHYSSCKKASKVAIIVVLSFFSWGCSLKDATQLQTNIINSIPENPLPAKVKEFLFEFFSADLLDHVRIANEETSQMVITWVKQANGFPNVTGFTLDRVIFTLKQNWSDCNYISLIAHEMVHTRQNYPDTLFQTVQYATETFKGMIKFHTLDQAYYNNPYEIEARGVENKVRDQCRKYPPFHQ
jgi:predicted RNA-binding Zn-ribbon protein involved in translation (DUF1610 family)